MNGDSTGLPTWFVNEPELDAMAEHCHGAPGQRNHGNRDTIAVGVGLSVILHGLLLAGATSLHAAESPAEQASSLRIARRDPLIVELLAFNLPAPGGAAKMAVPGPDDRPAQLPHAHRRTAARVAKARPVDTSSVTAPLAPVEPVELPPKSHPAPTDNGPPSQAVGGTDRMIGGENGRGTSGASGSIAAPGCCGNGTGAQGEPATPTTGRSPARPLQNSRPIYPRQARLMGWEGSVALRVLVDVQGNAAEVTVVTGSGYAVLDQAAVDAVRRWKFSPALDSGRPVAMPHDVRIRFRLDDNPG